LDYIVQIGAYLLSTLRYIKKYKIKIKTKMWTLRKLIAVVSYTIPFFPGLLFPDT